VKCPHCGKDGKALVTETRNGIEATYRRRNCGHCGRAFVTYELAPPGLKMPPAHNNRERTERVARSKEIRSTGAHLQNIW
jgi:transcriptional regulator NrdR family protein